MFKFEWDDQKASGYMQKHGVTFDETVRLIIRYYGKSKVERENKT